MKRPELTTREAALLRELQWMKGWVVQKLEPAVSGTAMYPALKRDIESASKAIQEATGGCEA
jgi:hypothetical protein